MQISKIINPQEFIILSFVCGFVLIYLFSWILICSIDEVIALVHCVPPPFALVIFTHVKKTNPDLTNHFAQSFDEDKNKVYCIWRISRIRQYDQLVSSLICLHPLSHDTFIWGERSA